MTCRKAASCLKNSKIGMFFSRQKEKNVVPEDPNVTMQPIQPEFIDPNRTDYNKTGVRELGDADFNPFVSEQDVCLVLFYSKDGEDSALAMEKFTEASEMTDRPYSAFAKVDCSKNFEICSEQAVLSIPYYKMFSKGVTVGSVRDYKTFPSITMKKYVERCPVLKQAPRPIPESYALKNCDK